jgi:hypothetical protein
MEYPKYHGNYLGIVVQNNDPLHRGRVKVFVPHISPTVYKSWVEDKKDKRFRFMGSNIESDLTQIITDLKEILPWAEVATPLAGESSSGRYNAQSNHATTSDSSNISFTEAYSSDVGAGNQNIDNVGEKPGNVFDMMNYRLCDAFNDPAATNINYVNKLSYNYVPECYSNSAKGAFPVLSVGAHVWIFFNSGDPLKPVIFASSFGSHEWCSIFDSTSASPGMDYPGKYENTIGGKDINTDTYRNKYIINQKGGTLAFVNTDNREMLKLTHFSGSFKEFNNMANIELATNNDQKLVLNDSFDTVRGMRNVFTQRDFDNVVRGDHYRKVGNLEASLYEKWKELWAPIADIKQLFDVQRTFGVQGELGAAGSFIKLNGSGQTQSGMPAMCPVCTANIRLDMAVNNTFDPPGFKKTSKPSTATHEDGDGAGAQMIDAEGVGYQVTYQDGRPAGPINLFLLMKNDGTYTDVFGNPLVQPPGEIGGIKCPSCNNSLGGGSITSGPGFSKSSFAGIWTPEPQKLLLPTMIAAVMPELAKVEAQMGLGGSEIVEITKHKVETIGMVMNDFGAVRVDPQGKMEPGYVLPSQFSTIVVNTPSPLVEQVHVDDLPGGTYTLNVCNRYSILVGAGGVNLKSYGVINISGAMANIAGEQVNIGSANEVNIDGGKRTSIVGDIVSIRQRNGEQVIIDSGLGINGNVIIRGGLYVEGDTGLQSMTCVSQKTTTDPVNAYGGGRQGLVGGTMLTCDYSHNMDETTGELMPGKGTAKTYLGYTDYNKVAGFIDKDTVIGTLMEGTIITGDFKGLSLAIGGIPTLIDITGATFTVTSITPSPLAVAAGVEGCIAAVDNLTQVKTLMQAGDPMADADALPGGGCYIRGTNDGVTVPSKPKNLSLRGQPYTDVIAAVEEAKAIYKAPGALYAPGFIVGNGCHSSYTQTATHVMTFEEPAVNKVATCSAVRKIHGKNINVLVSAKSIGDYHNITDEIVDPPDLPTTGLV